jgi:uncharacterized repeat protein (TIGR03803 family)
MRISEFGRYTLCFCTAFELLAGCGGGTPLNPSASALMTERTHVRPAYSVLHSFNKKKGEYPQAGLLDVNDTLYGTTIQGGAKGDGTLFAITTAGKETVLHSFAGGSGDGENPYAGVINVNGTLYGTTSQGGAYCSGSSGCGTVFAITPSGKETVLHSFAGGSGDGNYPEAGLINVKGMLYGTTYYGGANDDGTVFAITTSGKERVLYGFKGSPDDGSYPLASLINVKGTLYGTTESGGTYCISSYYCGTVFAITTSGKETVLHSFGHGTDGDYPYAGLLNVKGTLYGTTSEGGVHCTYGCGTVFAIAPSGKETVLHSFAGGAGDGSGPEAGLINVRGTLYGTTTYGDRNNYGTVFAITTTGNETVLHSFGGSGDGAEPYAGLLNVKGTLYGTTYFGGANCSPVGCGTVFSLSP